MQPSARLASVIEIIEAIETAWKSPMRQPVDVLLQHYFKARRYMGSKDRGAVAEQVYFILRNKLSLEWWCQSLAALSTPRLLAITALALRDGMSAGHIEQWFTGENHAPAPLSREESWYAKKIQGKELNSEEMPRHVRLNIPEWTEPMLRERFQKELDTAVAALSEEATTDLRTNTLKCTRESLQKALRAEQIESDPTPLSLTGLRLRKREAAFATRAFKQGWFEMQDEGSQLLAQLVDAQPGHKVIDFCAGAGGKTLALAASMHNKGRILAFDVSAKRLSQLPVRARRAGVHNITARQIDNESDSFLKRHKHSADRVLVDAPCSGSGTWRRNPDLKWRFTAQDLHELVALQQRILASAARLVKPGGVLVYATCSLYKSENEEQIARFISQHGNFRVVKPEKIWNKNPQHRSTDCDSFVCLTPHQDGTDGFFIARLENAADEIREIHSD